MSENDKPAGVQRRDVLRLLAVGAGTAGAMAAGSVVPAAAEGPVADESAAGYAETDHVRRFYETARF